MFECFDGLRVGLAVTGSFCTHRNVAAVADNLVKRGAIVYPILSYSSSETSTRFMTREELYDNLVRITGHEPICTIKEAEPIGPKKMFDILIIAPCSGNTLAKLANGISAGQANTDGLAVANQLQAIFICSVIIGIPITVGSIVCFRCGEVDTTAACTVYAGLQHASIIRS